MLPSDHPYQTRIVFQINSLLPSQSYTISFSAKSVVSLDATPHFWEGRDTGIASVSWYHFQTLKRREHLNKSSVESPLGTGLFTPMASLEDSGIGRAEADRRGSAEGEEQTSRRALDSEEDPQLPTHSCSANPKGIPGWGCQVRWSFLKDLPRL